MCEREREGVRNRRGLTRLTDRRVSERTRSLQLVIEATRTRPSGGSGGMGVCRARLAAAAVEASFAKALNRIEGLDLHDEPRKHWPSLRFVQLCMASRSLAP